jgi:hypothetical protein
MRLVRHCGAGIASAVTIQARESLRADAQRWTLYGHRWPPT